jgi:hypothetical protein
VTSAALLTGVWSEAGEWVAGRDLVPFLVWVGAVDVLYRRFHPALYPSLASYYTQNTPIATVAFNVIAGGLVWGAARVGSR